MWWKHGSFIRYSKLNWRPVTTGEGFLSEISRSIGKMRGIGNTAKVSQTRYEERKIRWWGLAHYMYVVSIHWKYIWMVDGWNDEWSGKILNIYNFTVLSSIESDIIFDCYIAFCNNLCCIFPSMSEENKSIMCSNRSLRKAKDIFCSAFFILFHINERF